MSRRSRGIAHCTKCTYAPKKCFLDSYVIICTYFEVNAAGMMIHVYRKSRPVVLITSSAGLVWFGLLEFIHQGPRKGTLSN